MYYIGVLNMTNMFNITRPRFVILYLDSPFALSSVERALK